MRLSITALIAVTALLGLILLGANLYVQSPSSQQQIKRHLSTAFGLPVTMDRAVFTPWGGLRVDGVRTEGAPGQPIVHAELVRVQIAWLALMRGRFVVKRVGLERPSVTLTQNSEGRWMAPLRVVAASTPAEPIVQPDPPSPEPSPDGPPQPHAVVTPVPPPVAVAPLIKEVLAASPTVRFPAGFEFFRLRHAELRFVDVKGREVAMLEDVNLEGRPVAGTAGDFSGKIWFEQASFIQQRVRVRRFSSTVRISGGVVSLPDGLGEIAGGRLEARLTVRPMEAGSPYQVGAKIDGVSLGRLIQEAGGDPDFASGRLQGTLDLSGLSADPSAQRGGGEMRLLDGQFRRGGLLKTFGERSKIEELRRPEFKVATLTYTIEGQDVVVAPLELDSANVRFTARGVCHLPATTLDLGARLVLAGEIAKQLPGFIATNFEASPETPGEKFIDFKIGGTISNPSTDLFQKTLTNPMQSLLGRMLGRNRKPAEEPAASPAPEPLPSPTASPPP